MATLVQRSSSKPIQLMIPVQFLVNLRVESLDVENAGSLRVYNGAPEDVPGLWQGCRRVGNWTTESEDRKQKKINLHKMWINPLHAVVKFCY